MCILFILRRRRRLLIPHFPYKLRCSDQKRTVNLFRSISFILSCRDTRMIKQRKSTIIIQIRRFRVVFGCDQAGLPQSLATCPTGFGISWPEFRTRNPKNLFDLRILLFECVCAINTHMHFLCTCIWTMCLSEISGFSCCNFLSLSTQNIIYYI